MGFSGDLKDIDLTNIFQTLGMNQHEGILKVTDSNRLAQIYFSKSGIRLLTDDTKPYSLLGELLLRKRLVTEDDLRKTLQLNFWRPGDSLAENEREIRYGAALGAADAYGTNEGVAYRWVYR